MKKSDELFQLIKSMINNEKRYFKLFTAMQKGDKNYIKLFEAIDRQKEYDEDEIKNIFKKTTFVKQLYSIKHYLYGLILKSLRAYHSGTSINMQLRSLLDSVEVLYKKGQNDSCRKMLAKAKKIANKYERYPYIIEIHLWERKFFNGQINFDKSSEKKLDNLLSKEQQTITRLSNITAYQHIMSQTLLYNRRKAGSSEKDKVLKKIENNLDKIKQAPVTHEEIYYYYYCNGSYSKSKGDFKQSTYFLKKNIAHLESHPDLFAENLDRYLFSLRSLFNYYGKLRQYNKVMLYFQKFKKTAEQHNDKFDSRRRMFISYSIHEFEINFSIATGEFKAGIALMQNMQKDLESFTQLPIEPLIGLRYMYAYLYFGAGLYKKTIECLNDVFLMSSQGLRIDILSYAKILNLITHFEMRNYELLPYIIKSTYRFLHKKKKLYKFEKLMLDFIGKKIMKINSPKELINAFRFLKVEIKKNIHDSNENDILEYFDLISWLESKIENRPFAEIVRDKARYSTQILPEICKQKRSLP